MGGDLGSVVETKWVSLREEINMQQWLDSCFSCIYVSEPNALKKIKDRKEKHFFFFEDPSEFCYIKVKIDADKNKHPFKLTFAHFNNCYDV